MHAFSMQLRKYELPICGFGRSVEVVSSRGQLHDPLAFEKACMLLE